VKANRMTAAKRRQIPSSESLLLVWEHCQNFSLLPLGLLLEWYFHDVRS